MEISIMSSDLGISNGRATNNLHVCTLLVMLLRHQFFVHMTIEMFIITRIRNFDYNYIIRNALFYKCVNMAKNCYLLFI